MNSLNILSERSRHCQRLYNRLSRYVSLRISKAPKKNIDPKQLRTVEDFEPMEALIKHGRLDVRGGHRVKSFHINYFEAVS